MKDIAFGTEGWRAVIGEGFTVERVRIVSQAIAEHVLALPRSGAAGKRMAVGYDTRFLSDRFAAAICEVLAANGIRVLLGDGAVPTCAVSRIVVDQGLTAGVMVTASHNPGSYNGIKVKEAFGGSATTQTVASIERRLGRHAPRGMPFDEALRRGMIRSIPMLPAFLRGIREYVDIPAIRRSPLKVVVDPMHGAANSLIEQMLKGGRCRVQTLHAQADPLFGGQAPEPIPSHLGELSRTLRRQRWDVGIATDGDADRLGIVAPNGSFITPGQVLCILLEHLMTSRGWHGAVVKTISNTSMIDRLAEDLGLRLYEVPVGFKHVAKLMLEDDVLIGGEESGGIGVRGYLPERDGIATGLLVLEAMAMQRRSLLEILRRLERRAGRWFYARRDLTLSPETVDRFFRRLSESPPTRLVGGVPVANVKTSDGIKLIGRDESWLLFRRSGTEPVVRVYAESLSAPRVARLLSFGAQLIKKTRGRPSRSTRT